MAQTSTIAKVKLALRITADDFNDEIADLIDACLLDLGIAGVTEDDIADPLIIRAICTYCKMSFGEPDSYELLKRSYDEQKAQMGMASGYTDWGTING